MTKKLQKKIPRNSWNNSRVTAEGVFEELLQKDSGSPGGASVGPFEELLMKFLEVFPRTFGENSEKFLKEFPRNYWRCSVWMNCLRTAGEIYEHLMKELF